MVVGVLGLGLQTLYAHIPYALRFTFYALFPPHILLTPILTKAPMIATMNRSWATTWVLTLTFNSSALNCGAEMRLASASCLRYCEAPAWPLTTALSPGPAIPLQGRAS